MVSKNQLKFIRSLNLKKNRIKHNMIVVEGLKTISEFIKSDFQLVKLFSTEKKKINNIKPELIMESELKSISNYKSPDGSLAIFNISERSIEDQTLYIVLDKIADPGNLGTIIRTCEWFGINQIICSESSVDCYNPKVIQSSMGSLSRVNVIYTDLIKFLKSKNLPIYLADLNGKKLKKSVINNECIWVFGSESHGISKKVKKLAHKSFTIPKYKKNIRTDSLNLSTSVAIILGLLRI